jgi:rhodanese-related sulfurtransferase
MSKLKTLIILSLVITTSLFAQSGSSTQYLTAPEFKKVVESKKHLLIDVRTPDEFADGHIAGAINIDINDPDFAKTVKNKTSKQKLVAVYCRSGRRSKVAISLIEPLKLQIVELNNGIISWEQAGYKVN